MYVCISCDCNFLETKPLELSFKIILYSKVIPSTFSFRIKVIDINIKNINSYGLIRTTHLIERYFISID